MTSASKHMARSHRGHADTQAVFGSSERKTLHKVPKDKTSLIDRIAKIFGFKIPK